MDVMWNSDSQRGLRECLLQICLEKFFLVSQAWKGASWSYCLASYPTEEVQGEKNVSEEMEVKRSFLEQG